jgi:hypothetical protein
VADIKTKNPNRVAAGKKAWRKAQRGGKVSKKKGSVKKGYSRAKATLGKTAKALVILIPAICVGAGSYVSWRTHGGTRGQAAVQGLGAWASCYTGVMVNVNGDIWPFHAEQLLIGWGPPLVIGGIQYVLRAVHQQGVNPFRQFSTMG